MAASSRDFGELKRELQSALERLAGLTAQQHDHSTLETSALSAALSLSLCCMCFFLSLSFITILVLAFPSFF